jgi:glycosyltransferase involved in cell wall biosynthesis
MATRDKRIKLFIEASAITEQKISGIGHNIVATLNALIDDGRLFNTHKIILLVPRGAKKTIDRWSFPSNKIEVKQIKLEKHLFHVLLKYGFLPPMDIFYGKGVYIFPNYKNWPLLFSKSLTYIYDVAYIIYPETIQPKNLKMLRRNVPKWINRTDMVLTISQNSKREIIKYLNIQDYKICIVYCGVDLKEYKREPEAQVRSVKDRYHIVGEYILFVGNLEPRKNINRLLKAYSLLPSETRNNYSLVLVGGGGWLNESIFSKIKELNSTGYKIVHPEAYVPDADLPKLYSGSSLLILPSIHEGFGIPPIQAMACGVPVAVSNIPVMREVVGEAGVYFNPFDSNSIAEIIEKTLTDKNIKKRLVFEGTLRAKYWSWDKSAERLSKYIYDLSE